MTNLIVTFFVICFYMTFSQNTTSITTNGTITFGISLTLSANSGSRGIFGRAIRDGLLLWEEWANSVYGGIRVNEKLYNFSVFYIEDYGNATIMYQNYVDMLDNNTGTNVDFYLGPVNTDFSLFVKPLFEQRQELLLATSVAAKAFYNHSNWMFSVVIPASLIFVGTAQDLRYHGIKRAVAFMEPNSFSLEACGTALQSALNNNGITLVKSYMVPMSLAYQDQSALSEADRTKYYSAIFDAVSNQLGEVYFFCSYPVGVESMLQALKLQNYLPKGIYVVPFTGAVANLPLDLVQYVSGIACWLPNRILPPDPYFGTPLDYANKFQARFSYPPFDFNAFGTASGLIMMLAIEAAQSFSKFNVRDAVARTNIEIFFGRVGFAVDHAQLLEPIGAQITDRGKFQVNSPYLGKTSDAIFPIPTWEERVLNTNFGKTPEIVVLVFVLLGILSSVVLICVTFYWKESAPFSAASPLFLYLFLVGSGILYSSILFWTLNATDVTCKFRIWFLGIGFVLMFGALVSKTYRVYKIFITAKNELRQIIFPNKELLKVLGIILGIEIVILILWSSISPIPAVHVVVDPYRSAYDYFECGYTQTDIAFLGINLVYCLALCLSGIYSSIRIWNIPYEFFNESKEIGFAMYNLFFFVALVFILQFAANIGHELMFGLRSFGIFLATGISVLSIFFEKVRNRNTQRSKISVGIILNKLEKKTKSTYESSESSSRDWQKEYFELLEKFEQLQSIRQY